MKTYPYLFLLMLSVGLIFSACKKEEVVSPQPLEKTSFRNLSVGDKFSYKEIHVDFDMNSNDPVSTKNCRYGDRILNVEVMEISTDGYVVKEYLSTESAEDIGKLALMIKDNMVEVVQLEDKTKYNESLFHSKVFNIAAVSSPLVELEEDCFNYGPASNVNSENGYAVGNAQIQGASYQNLYAYYFGDMVPVDGPGYIYLFNEEAMIIRSTTSGSFFPYLQGWELIPN